MWMLRKKENKKDFYKDDFFLNKDLCLSNQCHHAKWRRLDKEQFRGKEYN